MTDDATMSVSASEPRRPAITGASRVADIIVSVVLMLAGAAIVGTLAFFAPFNVMLSDTCGTDDCNLELFGAALYAGWFLPPMVYLAALVWAVVRMTQRRWSWWIPLAGLVVALIVWQVASNVMVSSVGG
ncbi:DUF6264 family protein [Microbacterium sp. HD4P20]|nr:DUF6264 family protein [Microbacterium sp. HD4P20]